MLGWITPIASFFSTLLLCAAVATTLGIVRALGFSTHHARIKTASPFAAKAMKRSVFFWRHALKVFRIVVKSILIFVMNMLAWLSTRTKSMLVFPIARLSFFDYVFISATRVMNPSRASRQTHPYGFKLPKPGLASTRADVLSSASSAAPRVVKAFTVGSRYTKNLVATIRTKFEQQFLHSRIIFQTLGEHKCPV